MGCDSELGVSVCVCQLGLTPLHQASQQGHVLIIKLLLKHRANPDALTTVSRSLNQLPAFSDDFMFI